MAYAPHAHLTFGGKFGDSVSGEEEWSCGIRLTTFSEATHLPSQLIDSTVADCQAALGEILPALEDLFISGDAAVNNNVHLSWAKLNAIGPNGKYLHDFTVEETFQPISGGAGGSTYKPFQISSVVTFRTDRDRGKAARGRIYWPGTSGTVSNLGYWNVPPTMADLFADFIAKLEVEGISAYFMPSVVSKLADPGNTAYRFITAVSVGNVLDTQRRRRNQLKEVYDTTPVTYTA